MSNIKNKDLGLEPDKSREKGFVVTVHFDEKIDAMKFYRFIHDMMLKNAVIADISESKKKKLFEKDLKRSGKTPTEQQEKDLLFYSDYDETRKELTLSPNQAGEIIGIDGKQLQAKCKNGKIEAYRNIIGWWHIPLRVVLEML